MEPCGTLCFQAFNGISCPAWFSWFQDIQYASDAGYSGIHGVELEERKRKAKKAKAEQVDVPYYQPIPSLSFPANRHIEWTLCKQMLKLVGMFCQMLLMRHLEKSSSLSKSHLKKESQATPSLKFALF